MDQQQEPTFEESLKEVMQSLPPVIRTYLSQGMYTVVAKSLMAKYGLRIDQGAVLEREIMLLLMGVETPAEFMQALAEEAKLSEQVIGGIVQEVNERIFLPLRAEEMKAGQSVRPAMPAERLQPVPQPVPAHFAPLPPRFLRSEATIKNQVESRNSELPPKAAMPRAVQSGGTLGDVVRSVLPAQKTPDNLNLLEDREEPHIEFSTAPAPQASRAVPPPNLPGAMAPRDIWAQSPIATPKREPAVPPLQRKAPAPDPLTTYSADPYREPVDEPVDEM
ncbi:MAG: hypothetical protein ACYCZZ_02155 [Minisyncoccota bacterium]